MNLYLVKKMATKSNKKNPIAKNLFTKKFKPKLVKPKKGKGSFKRNKKIQFYENYFGMSTLKLMTIRSSFELF